MIKEGKRRPNHLTDEEKLGEWSLKQRKSLEMSKNSEKDVGSMLLGEWSQNASSSQMRDVSGPALISTLLICCRDF